MGALALLAAYFLAGTIGLQLATVHSSASPVWPPTGIAIAGLVLLGLRAWPAVLVGAFLFNWNLPGHDLPSAIIIAGGNMLEGLAGAWVTIRFLNGKHAFHGVRSALGFAVVPGLGAPLISATVGVTTLGVLQLAPWNLYGAIWLTWWLGDIGGALIFAPAILAFASAPRESLAKRLPETTALLAATILAGSLAFLSPPNGIAPASVAVLGLLATIAWAALRFGPREINLALVALATLAVWGAVNSAGPFLRPTENQSLLLVQIFVVALAGSTLVMGGAAAERHDASAAKPARQRSRTPVVAVTLGILPLLLAALPLQAVLADLETAGQQQQRRAAADSLTGAFQRSLDEHMVRLAGAQAHFQSVSTFNRTEFRDFLDESGWLQARDLAAISFDRIIRADGLADYQAGVKGETALDPSLRNSFRVFPPTGADPHIVVDYIEPFRDNLPAWGYDVASNGTRLAAAHAAIDTGKPVATRPLNLIQDGGQRTGFLLFQAVYHGGDPGNVDGRRQAAFGFLVTVHRIPDLARAVVASLGASFAPTLVAVYDVGPATGRPPTSVPSGSPDLLAAANGAPVSHPPATGVALVPVPVHGRTWLVALNEPGEAVGATQRFAPWFVMLVGGILSTSFTLAAFAFESTTRRARTIAADLGQTVRIQKESLEEAQTIAHVGSWDWDIRRNVVTWSDELYRIFGLSREKFKASYEGYLAALHPDDRQHADAAVRQAMQDHQPFSFEHRVVHPDGSEVTVLGKGRVELDAAGQPVRMSGTAQDVTEIRRAEAQFQLLLESAPDAMVVVDNQGQVVLVNAEAERLFGYTRRELLGQPVEALVPEDKRDVHVRHRNQYMAHATRRPMGRGLELAARRKDGVEVPVEISLSPLESSEGQRVIATIRDITDRRAAEQERRAAQERSEELARLREVNRFKTQFINTAAHELRTPLMPLRTQVHLMLINPASPPTPVQAKALGVMKRNLERLGTLVEDLLTVARSQAGRLGIEPQPIDLGKTLAEAAEPFNAVSKDRQIKLMVQAAAGITLLADPKRITQVVSNLLSNAFKFTPKGGQVRLELLDEGVTVRVKVTDTGLGIAQPDLARLFQPFVQVHDTTQVTDPGSGLGLYICKQFIEVHGGSVGAMSPGRGKGATFWFTLPKVAVRPALMPGPDPLPAETKTQTLQNREPSPKEMPP